MSMKTLFCLRTPCNAFQVIRQPKIAASGELLSLLTPLLREAISVGTRFRQRVLPILPVPASSLSGLARDP